MKSCRAIGTLSATRASVAIDMKTDEVVLAADTPQELEEEIRADGLRNVMVMRAPTEDEPLFVGPG
jgi:hypothetical protein